MWKGVRDSDAVGGILAQMRKALVFFYLIILGFSYMSLAFFFGFFGGGGVVLTPSAHPYIPPLSVVIATPSDVCSGWSIYYMRARFLTVDVYVPIVHYFSNGYELANYFTLGTSPIETLRNYVEALIQPKWVVMPMGNKKCVAQVIAVIPAPLVIISFSALFIPIYYKYRRVW